MAKRCEVCNKGPDGRQQRQPRDEQDEASLAAQSAGSKDQRSRHRPHGARLHVLSARKESHARRLVRLTLPAKMAAERPPFFVLQDRIAALSKQPLPSPSTRSDRVQTNIEWHTISYYDSTGCVVKRE